MSPDTVSPEKKPVPPWVGQLLPRLQGRPGARCWWAGEAAPRERRDVPRAVTDLPPLLGFRRLHRGREGTSAEPAGDLEPGNRRRPEVTPQPPRCPPPHARPHLSAWVLCTARGPAPSLAVTSWPSSSKSASTYAALWTRCCRGTGERGRGGVGGGTGSMGTGDWGHRECGQRGEGAQWSAPPPHTHPGRGPAHPAPKLSGGENNLLKCLGDWNGLRCH